MLASWVFRLQKRIFEAWCGDIASIRKTRANGKKFVRRFCNMRAARAFSTWRAVRDEAMGQADTLRWVQRQWVHGRMGMAYRSWVEHAHERAQVRRVLFRAIKALMMVPQRHAMNVFVEHFSQRRAVSDSLGHVLAYWRNRSLASAFLFWEELARAYWAEQARVCSSAYLRTSLSSSGPANACLAVYVKTHALRLHHQLVAQDPRDDVEAEVCLLDTPRMWSLVLPPRYPDCNTYYTPCLPWPQAKRRERSIHAKELLSLPLRKLGSKTGLWRSAEMVAERLLQRPSPSLCCEGGSGGLLGVSEFECPMDWIAEVGPVEEKRRRLNPFARRYVWRLRFSVLGRARMGVASMSFSCEEEEAAKCWVEQCAAASRTTPHLSLKGRESMPPFGQR